MVCFPDEISLHSYRAYSIATSRMKRRKAPLTVAASISQSSVPTLFKITVLTYNLANITTSVIPQKTPLIARIDGAFVDRSIGPVGGGPNCLVRREGMILLVVPISGPCVTENFDVQISSRQSVWRTAQLHWFDRLLRQCYQIGEVMLHREVETALYRPKECPPFQSPKSEGCSRISISQIHREVQTHSVDPHYRVNEQEPFVPSS